jgi:hypothetical protein
MNRIKTPFAFALSTLLLLPALARAQDAIDPFDAKATATLAEIQRELIDLQASLHKELDGKEFDRGYGVKKIDPAQLDEWFKDALPALKDALAAQQADRAKLKANDPRFTTAEYHAATYNRILDSIVRLWAIHLHAAGGSVGRIKVLAARDTRFHEKQWKELEEARKPLEQKFQAGKMTYQEYDAAVKKLRAAAAEQTVQFMAGLAKDYTTVGEDLARHRARLAGLTWRWQDVAYRRVTVAGDSHDAAAKEFKAKLDALFQLHPRSGSSALDFFILFPGSADRLIIANSFLNDDKVRHPDIEVRGPRLFKMV